MKLNEIVKKEYTTTADVRDLEIIKKLSSRTVVGKLEHKTIYRSEHNEVVMYDVDGVAAIQGVEKPIGIGSGKCFKVGQVLVDPNFQRKGYGTLLYKALLQNLKFVLWSDNTMSTGAIALWKSLVTSGYTVYQFDASTSSFGDELTSPNEIDAAVNGSPDTTLLASDGPLKPLSEGQIYLDIPYMWDGILSPRINYTFEGSTLF